MKNIAILIPTIKPGGAEKQASLLAVTLAKEHKVHFISFYGHINESSLIKNNLESANVIIHYFDGDFISKCVVYYKFLKSNKIDIAFNYITNCDVVGSLIEKLAGVPVIYNGIRNSRLAKLKMIAERFAHNCIANYTIYNCYSGAKYFESKGFKKKKTIVIPNCFPNISEPISRKDKEIKTIITVGRFEKQKDYHTAIRAIAELSKRTQDFRFVIIGHGHLEQQIYGWIEEYAISSQTQVYIAPENVQEILKESDIYLSTSLFEGTSNSIMEALNWSLPVVATRVGDNDHLVEDKKNGFLTEIGNYKRIADYLEQLVYNYDLRISMGLKSNTMVHNYSVDIFKEKYREIII